MKAKVTLVLTMDEATIEDFMAWMGWPKEELTCQGAIQKDFTEEDVKKELEECDTQKLIDWCDTDWDASTIEVETSDGK